VDAVEVERRHAEALAQRGVERGRRLDDAALDLERGVAVPDIEIVTMSSERSFSLVR